MESKKCCDNSGGQAGGDSLQAFGALMRSTSQAGAIDERAKELINFALVLMARCEPCVQAHLAKARKMGITQEELDEAAWCATVMGGAPVRMFYTEMLDAESEGDACCSN